MIKCGGYQPTDNYAFAYILKDQGYLSLKYLNRF